MCHHFIGEISKNEGRERESDKNECVVIEGERGETRLRLKKGIGLSWLHVTL